LVRYDGTPGRAPVTGRPRSGTTDRDPGPAGRPGGRAAGRLPAAAAFRAWPIDAVEVEFASFFVELHSTVDTASKSRVE
ncbi:hypothetical protein, partial [Streptomyces sp. NPDC048845]|uniref:hypothetical protein n=1 Tax=Streptomyces sp. NPDC048845 TaxID=3155390 RepID=UPI003435539F